ncbi:hypothetical protein V8G54_034719 [Vigna mungo]|uniref:TRAF-type domain-containing protein n=1 Tax=Vigna mungo TaxID=3915 RepID=A0AAQ3MDM1_VIGMU
MEAVPDQDTSICTHCERAVPVANIDLHYAHCSRKLEKCKICGDMVPRKNVEDHYLNTHAPFKANQIVKTYDEHSETMERDILDIHKGEECPQRIVTCEFCEFPLPAIDLAEHQEVCGNRTELCHICNKYVRLRERFSHEARCNGIIQDTSVGSSRVNSCVAVSFQASTYTIGLVASCSRHKSSFESSFNMLSYSMSCILSYFLSCHAITPILFTGLFSSCSRVRNPNLRSLILLSHLTIISAKIFFGERFENKWENGWVKSDWKENVGEWNHTSGQGNGDANEDYKFYAISAKDPRFSNKDKTLVFQFLVMYEQKLNYGGGYMKLLSGNVNQKKCGGDTPYCIMNVRETEGDPGAARRRPQNDFSTKRLLFTIAITGIAVILGSFFLQRKAEPSDVH